MEESSHKKMFLRKNIRIVFFDKIKHLTFAKRGNTHFKRQIRSEKYNKCFCGKQTKIFP